MRIGVYAISLNEEKFAKRWAESVQAADYALVADTGSTDATMQILIANKIDVGAIRIKPFRFDDARNAALALLPADLDVVIALDLDEVLVADWRSKIEQHWTAETTRLRYRYIWSWKGSEPDLIYLGDKIHGRFSHRWKAPVHEVLTPTIPEVVATYDGDVLIEHYPDSTKSRAQYISLLEIATKEDPLDDRNAHYLGREYMYYSHHRQAIAELHRHLALPRAVWRPERAASMRYIAKCHNELGETELAHQWYVRATLEEPNSREALIDAAKFLLTQNLFHATIAYCQRAEALPAFSGDYMAERYARNEGAADLMGVALWHIGQRVQGIECARRAVALNPHDPRLMCNLQAMQVAIDE